MDIKLGNCSYQTDMHFNEFDLSGILQHFKSPKALFRRMPGWILGKVMVLD
jgi:hypothetical protein